MEPVSEFSVNGWTNPAAAHLLGSFAQKRKYKTSISCSFTSGRVSSKDMEFDVLIVEPLKCSFFYYL